jgi:uncharacterized protein (DUF983 family)
MLKIPNNEPPRSLASSITTMRCPRCREGKMFQHPLYSWKFMDMNKACPYCGQSFILEPGFFLGASFFSYFINAILLTTVALALYYSGVQITVAVTIASTVLIVFGLLPITLRVSKSVWIHLFIRYKAT